MNREIKYFSADYRDDSVYIAEKKFSIGYFIVSFLNQYNINDTGARVASMSISNSFITSQIRLGYLNDIDFIDAGKEIIFILNVLPSLMPFSLLNTEHEINRIKNIFTKENAYTIKEYFARRAKIGLMDEGAVALNVLPNEYDENFFNTAIALINDATDALNFYRVIGKDFIKAHEGLMTFVKKLDSLEHFDEENLLSLATEVFKNNPFSVTTQYVSVKKAQKTVVGKRITFTDYYSFLMTDLYEGIHYNHYPRKCAVCKKYFLMKNARHQMYCNGNAPKELTGGKTLSCRKYAAKNVQKEFSEDHPLKDIYRKRCSCIRTEKARGTISPDFAMLAAKIARNNLKSALIDNEYANSRYEKDMQKENLYAKVKEVLK